MRYGISTLLLLVLLLSACGRTTEPEGLSEPAQLQLLGVVNPGETERVSVRSDDVQASGGSYEPSTSADGRYVAFHSNASDLVTGDTNGTWDVFVHDRQTGTTERVSVSSSGGQGNNPSQYPSISGSGRFVAFESFASNLMPGDTNNHADIFVHDRQTGTTERVSVSSSGTEGNTFSLAPSINADGRYVAFGSLASNLVPGDTNDTWDVFVRDLQNGTTQRASVSSDGGEGNNLSFAPSISANGQHVAFHSQASNLVFGDTNGTMDVFVHHLSPTDTTPPDTTPPIISPTISGTLGTNGWYTSDVTVSWIVADGESMIASTSGCDPTEISSDTPGLTLTCEATSAGGTASETITVKRDATAPVVMPSSAYTPGTWTNESVVVAFSCAPGISGVAAETALVTVADEGEGQSATSTCTDNAGNQGSATFSGIDIDKTPPALSPGVTPNPVLLNGSATASAGATDSLSGVASESCDAVDTSTVGANKTVSCTAIDNAGNTSSAAASYSVHYGFEGFSRPVENPSVLNVAKAGQTIPLKWRLLDASGIPVTTLGSATVTVTSLSCSLGSSTDQVEEYASGASGLQNLGDGYYQFNWQMPKNYANSCKTMQLNLGEGSRRTALFQFVR